MERKNIHIQPRNKTPDKKIRIRAVDHKKKEAEDNSKKKSPLDFLTDLSANQKKMILFSALGILALSLLILFLPSGDTQSDHSLTENKEEEITDPENDSHTFTQKDDDGLEILLQEVSKTEDYPATILQRHGVRIHTLDALEEELDSEDLLYQKLDNSMFTLWTKPGEARIQKFRFESSPYESWELGLGDSIYARKIKKKVHITAQSYSTIIRTSLQESLDKLPLSHQLGEKLDSALGWTVDLYHLPPNTKVKLLYDALLVDGKLDRIEKLKAVYLKEGIREHYAYYFEQAKKKGFFDGSARPMKTTFLKAPIKYSRISSTYGMRRHPISNTSEFHAGTDYVAAAGSQIYALADGKVIDARYNEANGYYVHIQHLDGIETFYLHMQKNSFPKDVKKGMRVSQGQQIGRVGSTGSSTGPHVCVHIKRDGNPLNPNSMIVSKSKPLASEYLTSFYLLKDELKLQLDNIKTFE